jgi:hypothetical protein
MREVDMVTMDNTLKFSFFCNWLRWTISILFFYLILLIFNEKLLNYKRIISIKGEILKIKEEFNKIFEKLKNI